MQSQSALVTRGRLIVGPLPQRRLNHLRRRAPSQIAAPEDATADSIVADATAFAQSEALYLAGGRLGQFIDEIDDVRVLKALEPRLAPFPKLRFERRLGNLP